MLIGKDIQIYVKTTETCNLNCSHCFTSGTSGAKVYFSPNKTITFLKNIIHQEKIRSIRLVLHGGEPLLAPIGDLNQFCKMAKNLDSKISFAIQTNLTFPLTADILKFLDNDLLHYGIGTSWDANIRFNKSRQEDLWEKNVKLLITKGHKITVMVCLSDHLIRTFTPKEIIEKMIKLGIQSITFERITKNGNAQESDSLFPSNKLLDSWIKEMYFVTLKHKFYEKIQNTLLSEIMLSFSNNIHSGNRCRNCEQHLITINATGTLAGCPNSAAEENWGNISLPVESFLKSPKRLNAMCSEKERNINCYSCPVKSICNGDCYKLPWQGDTCAAPKSLMIQIKKEGLTQENKELLI